MDKTKIPLSEIYRISHPIPEKAGIQLYVKREDLIHPQISGNKWRKLKYSIKHVIEHGYEGMVTFGGAYSNHLHAFAYACNHFRISGLVIVRGEVNDPDNPTLADVRKFGLDVIGVDRSDYRLKEESSVIKKILHQYQGYFLVPEGGSSELARGGIHELAHEIENYKTSFDIISISAGTGCTAGCLIDGLKLKRSDVEVYSALKGKFMQKAVSKWCPDRTNWDLYEDDIFGGYAKVSDALVHFMNDFMETTGVPIDPIYNGKLLYRLMNNIQSGKYPNDHKILWIHTGGLQGIRGFNQRWKGKYQINVNVKSVTSRERGDV